VGCWKRIDQNFQVPLLLPGGTCSAVLAQPFSPGGSCPAVLAQPFLLSRSRQAALARRLLLSRSCSAAFCAFTFSISPSLLPN